MTNNNTLPAGWTIEVFCSVEDGSPWFHLYNADEEYVDLFATRKAAVAAAKEMNR